MHTVDLQKQTAGSDRAISCLFRLMLIRSTPLRRRRSALGRLSAASPPKAAPESPGGSPDPGDSPGKQVGRNRSARQPRHRLLRLPKTILRVASSVLLLHPMIQNTAACYYSYGIRYLTPSGSDRCKFKVEFDEQAASATIPILCCAYDSWHLKGYCPILLAYTTDRSGSIMIKP